MRILIIGSPESSFCREIKSAATHCGIDCQIALFECLTSSLKTSTETIAVHSTQSTQFTLGRGDVCLVRNMPAGSLEQIIFRMDLLWSLEASGVRVINPPKAIECAVDKYLTLARCRHAGIPIPQTCCCQSADQAMAMFEKMNCDVVLKPLFGAEGRGVLRITDSQTARNVFQEREQAGSILYLQQYLEGEQKEQSDLRILMLGGHPLGAIRRTSSTDFRTNCSLNGRATLHLLTEDEIDLANRSCQATGTVFAGVDLIYNSEGELHVLEVNACPGWNAFRQATQIDVPARLIQWIHTKFSEEASIPVKKKK